MDGRCCHGSLLRLRTDDRRAAVRRRRARSLQYGRLVFVRRRLCGCELRHYVRGRRVGRTVLGALGTGTLSVEAIIAAMFLPITFFHGLKAVSSLQRNSFHNDHFLYDLTNGPQGATCNADGTCTCVRYSAKGRGTEKDENREYFQSSYILSPNRPNRLSVRALETIIMFSTKKLCKTVFSDPPIFYSLQYFLRN
jgi:hypothetical protein